MGPDTWEAVKQIFTIEMAESMFNFEKGLKIKMLKVHYFKNSNIAGHLYDRNHATYGRIPWNEEVLIYFAKLFLGMKPNYNDLPSECFGPGKGQLCDHRGDKRDSDLPRLDPPLVSRPLCAKNLRSEIDATSQTF